jgi:hypothetical protein
VNNYIKRLDFDNSQPDHFGWHRQRELHRANPAARRIAEKFGIGLNHAVTVVALAGIGSEMPQ